LPRKLRENNEIISDMIGGLTHINWVCEKKS